MSSDASRVDRIVHVCAALLITLCLPTDAAARWTTLESQHFVFVGDASEREIRSVAERIEEFREVVARILPGTTETSKPTVVVVFADDRSLRPYAPQYQGRPTEVAGYFLDGEDGGTIVVNADVEDAALSVVFHEYAHSIVANTGLELPPWAGEGFAELYETFQTRDGGRSAVIGTAPAHHVELLRSSTLIPMAQLLAVTHDSAMYNEGSRRGVFYAQSWALMHYLMLGNERRAKQLRGYLAALRTGIAPEQAFRDAFGADHSALQQELLGYIRKFTFPALKYDFGDKLAKTVTGRGEPLEDADAQGYLGDLLGRLGRTDEARARLTDAMAANPKAVRPAVSLGQLLLRDGKIDEAVAALGAAVSRGPSDATAHAALGRALYLKLTERDTATEGEVRRAQAVLARALELDPGDGRTPALLASLEMRPGGDVDRAAAFLAQAIKAAPSNEQYRLMNAGLLIRMRQFEQATAVLGRLMATGRTTEIREAARRLMGDGVKYRMALEAGAATAATVPSAPEVNAVSLARPDTTSVPTGPAAPRVILDLRPVGPGEIRVRGRFVAIECAAGAVVVVIDVGGQTLRLGAQRFDQIAFITYRSNTPSSVSCGPQATPPPVLATYRTGGPRIEGAAHGEIVAIELVPDGYSPPN